VLATSLVHKTDTIPRFTSRSCSWRFAGFNASAFYLVACRRTMGPDAEPQVPRAARIVATISILMWIGVIVCGRLLTFYRPGICGPEPPLIADCMPAFIGPAEAVRRILSGRPRIADPFNQPSGKTPANEAL
jgi:hypothetical protein